MSAKFFNRLLSVIALCLTFSAAAAAGTVTLEASDSGWYTQAGFHESANENYGVGKQFFTIRRNFFVFDLSTVGPGTVVTGAALRLTIPTNGFASTEASETYALYDVITPAEILTADQATREDVFADLGSGTLFGQVSISEADENTLLTISLNAAALLAINDSPGVFSVGGAVTTLSNSPASTEFIFLFSNPPNVVRHLVLTTTPVPEPATMFLLGAGLAVLGGVSKARRRTN